MGDNDFLADLAERYFWQLSELFGHETLLKIPNNKIETDPSESLNSFQSQKSYQLLMALKLWF